MLSLVFTGRGQNGNEYWRFLIRHTCHKVIYRIMRKPLPSMLRPILIAMVLAAMACDAAAADTDGDGLPDAWELQYFGNLNQGPNDDPDRDGFSNLAEYQNGSNPTNPNSVPGDTDGDNLPDAWEMFAFGTLTNWAYGDADGDSYNNLSEMISATSPRNATSHPNWISPRVAFLNDSVATTNALLMPTGVEFGRAINGVSFQADILITFNGYQYTAWYDNVGPAH